MGEKFLLALLSVMLVILLVFNSFGIAYSNNNFFGTILTVEEKFGETSEILLTSYDRLKEFFLSVGDFATSFYDATFGKFIEWLEDYTGFTVLEIINQGIQDVVNFFRESSLGFDYFAKNGISFSADYWNRFSAFARCVKSDQFWEDYSTRTGFKWDMCQAYISAVIDGKENEFAYEIYNLKNNIATFWNQRFSAGEKMFIGCIKEETYSTNDILSALDFRYYFTTCDLSTDDLANLLPNKDMFFYKYVTDENIDFPVYDTNIYIEDDNGIKYILKRFRLVTDISSYVPYEDIVKYSAPIQWLFDNNPTPLFGFDVINDEGQLVPVWYPAGYVLEILSQRDMSWWESVWFSFTSAFDIWKCYPLTEW